MTSPSLPPQGSTSWYAYMQWLDETARNGGSTVSDATTTTKGIVELATTAETTTGTDTSRAVTPAGVKAVADTKITSSDIDNDVVLTQAAYNALATKNSRTRYTIVG